MSWISCQAKGQNVYSLKPPVCVFKTRKRLWSRNDEESWFLQRRSTQLCKIQNIMSQLNWMSNYWLEISTETVRRIWTSTMETERHSIGLISSEEMEKHVWVWGLGDGDCRLLKCKVYEIIEEYIVKNGSRRVGVMAILFATEGLCLNRDEKNETFHP